MTDRMNEIILAIVEDLTVGARKTMDESPIEAIPYFISAQEKLKIILDSMIEESY